MNNNFKKCKIVPLIMINVDMKLVQNVNLNHNEIISWLWYITFSKSKENTGINLKVWQLHHNCFYQSLADPILQK